MRIVASSSFDVAWWPATGAGLSLHVSLRDPDPSMPSKLPRVDATISTRMSVLAQDAGALNLSQGFPDFEPPSRLAQALGEHALGGYNQSAPMIGLPRLRDASADQQRRWRRVEVDPEMKIIVVPGATERIFCAITAVINPGDEVIVPDPVSLA